MLTNTYDVNVIEIKTRDAAFKKEFIMYYDSTINAICRISLDKGIHTIEYKNNNRFFPCCVNERNEDIFFTSYNCCNVIKYNVIDGSVSCYFDDYECGKDILYKETYIIDGNLYFLPNNERALFKVFNTDTNIYMKKRIPEELNKLMHGGNTQLIYSCYKNLIAGIVYDNNIFFTYDIRKEKVKIYNTSCCHNLRTVCMGDGVIWLTNDEGKVLCFDIDKGIETLIFQDELLYSASVLLEDGIMLFSKTDNSLLNIEKNGKCINRVKIGGDGLDGVFKMKTIGNSVLLCPSRGNRFVSYDHKHCLIREILVPNTKEYDIEILKTGFFNNELLVSEKEEQLSHFLLGIV